MATYSLSCGLFVFDKEGKPVGDQIAGLEAIARAGFRETELMAEGPGWEQAGSRDVNKYRAVLERFGIFPHTIHTPLIDVYLTSSDEALRADAVARIADAMRFLGELGGRTAIVHPWSRPGPSDPPFTLENVGAAIERGYRSVSELVKVAEQTGVRIALENLTNRGRDCRPVVTMHELRALISRFPPEQVGLCLDTGHACMSGLDPAEQARIASDRLYALHIQDIDGQNDCHWLPGRGVIDWNAVGSALADIQFDGAWTIEPLAARTNATEEQIAAESGVLREQWETRGMANVKS